MIYKDRSLGVGPPSYSSTISSSQKLNLFAKTVFPSKVTSLGFGAQDIDWSFGGHHLPVTHSILVLLPPTN